MFRLKKTFNQYTPNDIKFTSAYGGANTYRFIRVYNQNTING